MGAPTCTLKPTKPGPNAPVVYAENIPPATPDNILQVVNAIRVYIMNGANGAPGAPGQNGQNYGGGFQGFQPNQFKVSQQTVQDVKVYDPNDPTGNTYVTVRQITSLTLQNPYDKSTWTWNQSSSVPSGGSGSGQAGGGCSG